MDSNQVNAQQPSIADNEPREPAAAAAEQPSGAMELQETTVQLADSVEAEDVAAEAETEEPLAPPAASGPPEEPVEETVVEGQAGTELIPVAEDGLTQPADDQSQSSGEGVPAVEMPDTTEAAELTDQPVAILQQVTSDSNDDDGDEMPFVAVSAGSQSLTDYIGSNTLLTENLRRVEGELEYLREQVRHDPSLLAAIQEQQSKLDYAASTTFEVSEKLVELSRTVAALSVELQKVSEETERILSWSSSTKIRGALSAWYLIISMAVLAALFGAIIYLSINQIQLQKRQDKLSSVAVHAVEAQEKRMTEFNKQFAHLVGTEIKSERELISKEAVMSKLNRLRGGVAEQRLLRKSNGDWLIARGKSEELISDHEIVELLNRAFEKSGKSLLIPPSMPPHKMVSILKPNGKGGTDVVVTQETVPHASGQ